jgi:trehalose synthase
MASISDYAPIVGEDVIEELRAVAERVKGRRLQHINSTRVGGGVAEILTRLVPLLQDLGIETSWDVMDGDEAFFRTTKAFHNALHGTPVQVTSEMLEAYRTTTKRNLGSMKLDADVIVIHDPQPAGLIERRGEAGKYWVWRCHIDASRPQPEVWKFLRGFVERYDAAIFSRPDFAQTLPISQYMVEPSIDPLADKNRDLEPAAVHSVFQKYKIDLERPVLTQISRFDRLKDLVGVIAAYRMARKRHDCQLVLAGGGAADDPEGAEVLREVRETADGDVDIHILELPPNSDLEINALVRGSMIVFQKSIREGFGLTVTEALWKRKPVIGGATGGIRAQVLNGITGFLVHSAEGAGQRAIELLGDAQLRERLGKNGYMHVKQNYLITRHVKDYLLLMLALEHPQEDVVFLDGGLAA